MALSPAARVRQSSLIAPSETTAFAHTPLIESRGPVAAVFAIRCGSTDVCVYTASLESARWQPRRRRGRSRSAGKQQREQSRGPCSRCPRARRRATRAATRQLGEGDVWSSEASPASRRCRGTDHCRPRGSPRRVADPSWQPVKGSSEGCTLRGRSGYIR